MGMALHVPAVGDREALLAEAERQCAAVGEVLTPLRRVVLELLLDQPGPTKAYDLLDALKADRSSAKPPTIYRALEFLMRLGFVHRIESLNAFIACDLGHDHGPPVFLICERCSSAAELHADKAFHAVRDAAAERGFQVRRTVIEASGLCAACVAAAA
jgi:Fur family zinc uptake transcriptional regulator